MNLSEQESFLLDLSEDEIRVVAEANPGLVEALYSKLQSIHRSREDPPYVKALFGPQMRFFRDPAKKKVALCSRRAGKTEAIAAWLLEGAESNPGGLSVYIALSRNNCRRILWRTMEDLQRRHNIPIKLGEKDNQLEITWLPNGHKIWLAGCKDSAEIDKFRGMKFRRVAIDEGASFGPYLRELVFDVLEPALLDLNGEMAIIGTPGVIPTGLFFEISTGSGLDKDAAKQWSTHSWTCIQNPYIQLSDIPESEWSDEVAAAESPDYVNHRARSWLDAKMQSNGWDETHPTYLREWCGIWKRDEGALVYLYNPDINSYRFLPEDSENDRWTFAIGVDVGFNDDSAFVVGAYRHGIPEVFLVHAEKRAHMTPSQVAVRIETLKNKWNASRVVMDTGGIGKGYAEEYALRFGVAVQRAEKSKKRAYIEHLRGDLLSGKIKINPENCAPLLLEWSRMVWNEDHSAPDERFPDHCSDACLYLCRMLIPWNSPEYLRDPPTPAELDQAVNSEHKARLSRRLMLNAASKQNRRAALSRFMSGR